MSIRKISLVEGEFYHVYNRGNSKQNIFHDRQDYGHFMGLLYACNSFNNFRSYDLDKKETIYDLDRGTLLVNIGAYCLMPNHFHILITQTENGSISKFMQKLTTAYVMYYNKKYRRTGGLFEGKFKAINFKKDNHLKYLFSYIHLNPIKLIDKNWKENGIHDVQKTSMYLNGYLYSSYLDFLGKKRIQEKILDNHSFPDYFQSKKEFLVEIFEWINFNKNDNPNF